MGGTKGPSQDDAVRLRLFTYVFYDTGHNASSDTRVGANPGLGSSGSGSNETDDQGLQTRYMFPLGN
ncbi:Hypothetical predicted protein, partial [Pelobates cultripes]